MSENKFKEFWIDIDYIHGIHLLYKKSTFYDYHVIEYSAYEQAQKEIEILRKAVQLQREGLEEIAANQAIGEVDLRGHFEGYQKYELLDCTVNDTEIARQTLKEVDELLKGEK